MHQRHHKNMRIGVLGATGVVGRYLVPRLIENGHTVRCIVRDRHRALTFERYGCQVVQADILKPESLPAMVDGCDAVINIATSIPGASGRGNWAINDQIRIEGTKNLVDTLAHYNPGCHLILQSVAMLHHSQAIPVDESAQTSGEGILASAITMEEIIVASKLAWTLARGGALYGPGTSRNLSWAHAIGAGMLKAPEDAERWISLLHVSDFASALAHLLTVERNQAYLVADDEPVRVGDLFDHIARVQGSPAPERGEKNGLRSFCVSNRKVRATGWQPAYPTFRSGINELLEEG